MAQDFASGTIYSRDIEYSIKCVKRNANSCEVETQKLKSGEVWRSQFTSDQIETMTRKTGSFKKYATFVKMLSDAITHTTEDVYIDILTYTDLLDLKGGGVGSKTSKPSDTKRYLILTYRVKYDTVNYPLPLQYAGKMSTAEVEDNVAKLQDEIDRLKTQIVSVTSPYKRKHGSCCKETAELRKQVEELRGGMADGGEQTTLIKTLQNALHNLESDMIREKNKYQRALDKKGVECRKLVLEVENLRSENRALTVKLRSVTTELNVEKRNKLYKTPTPRSSKRPPERQTGSRQSSFERNRANSRQSSFDKNRASSRQSSIDRNRVKGRQSSFERNRPGSRPNSIDRNRPSSRHCSFERNRPGSRNNSASSRQSSLGRNSRQSSVERPTGRGSSADRRRPASTESRRSVRTPSPGPFPRFDPSAYVRDKQRRIEENRSKRARETRTNTYLPRARSTPVERRRDSPSLYHARPPSGVVRDIIRDNLERGSCSSMVSEDDEGGSPVVRSDNEGDKENRKYLNNVSNLSFTKDSEIAEIDARLSALQTYLKDAQTRNY